MIIAIIGNGAFGTALAISLSQKNADIMFWGRNLQQMDEICAQRENTAKLAGAILPPALTLACADGELGVRLQYQLTISNLRLYRSTDTIGAELGGAIKNLIAIACGAAVGVGLGDSARAALMTPRLCRDAAHGLASRRAARNPCRTVWIWRPDPHLQYQSVAQLPLWGRGATLPQPSPLRGPPQHVPPCSGPALLG